MTDLHQMIVDHVGQVIGRIAVALEEHDVVELVIREGDFSAQQVLNRALALLRHGEANDMGLAGSAPFCCF